MLQFHIIFVTFSLLPLSRPLSLALVVITLVTVTVLVLSIALRLLEFPLVNQSDRLLKADSSENVRSHLFTVCYTAPESSHGPDTDGRRLLTLAIGT
jgi:hypothetical protein